MNGGEVMLEPSGQPVFFENGFGQVSQGVRWGKGHGRGDSVGAQRYKASPPEGGEHGSACGSASKLEARFFAAQLKGQVACGYFRLVVGKEPHLGQPMSGGSLNARYISQGIDSFPGRFQAVGINLQPAPGPCQWGAAQTRGRLVAGDG